MLHVPDITEIIDVGMENVRVALKMQAVVLKIVVVVFHPNNHQPHPNLNKVQLNKNL